MGETDPQNSNGSCKLKPEPEFEPDPDDDPRRNFPQLNVKPFKDAGLKSGKHDWCLPG